MSQLKMPASVSSMLNELLELTSQQVLDGAIPCLELQLDDINTQSVVKIIDEVEYLSTCARLSPVHHTVLKFFSEHESGLQAVAMKFSAAWFIEEESLTIVRKVHAEKLWDVPCILNAIVETKELFSLLPLQGEQNKSFIVSPPQEIYWN